MTDHAKASTLSPAAFAIVKAAHQADYASRPGIAAALRAAAIEIDAPLSITHVPEQQQRWYGLGVANFKRKLIAIAAELEGDHD